MRFTFSKHASTSTILVKSFLVSFILTILIYTIPLWIPNVDLLLVPLMILLFSTGAIGVITIPLAIIYIIRKKEFTDRMSVVNGAALGIYFGLLNLIPINNWDENQRNLGGHILVEELQTMKLKTGFYPVSLQQLNRIEMDKKLPVNYKLNRYSYTIKDDSFDLDIPVPIMDRWHWNIQAGRFEYADF